ncbi:MAG: GntR family transcriptional regulator [Proteobacteria bacterium]|nr:GntR family transcriptional regulator [Pseudomonadota bacterium]
MFTLDPHSGIPIYRQLQEQVRRLVASGQLRAGVELPSVRDLALAHAVNPMTISKAYSLLEAEGLLQRNRGRPMTVAPRRRAVDPAERRLKQIEPQAEALVQSARQLELAAGAGGPARPYLGEGSRMTDTWSKHATSPKTPVVGRS